MNFVNLVNEPGIDPIKWHNPRFRLRSLAKFPHDSGIVPYKSFSYTENPSNDDNVEISDGNVPFKLLWTEYYKEMMRLHE